MYNPDRIIHRTYKMAQERGWTQFDDDDKVMNRDIKINLLINEDMSNIAYVAEYKTQYPKFFEIDGAGSFTQDFSGPARGIRL